jgi:glutathione S-transferase
MCPYAQRALYTSSFKKLQVEIYHVSLAHPSAWFLEINPSGETPSCRVSSGGREFKLSESLNISEYLESFPGPYLYPRLPIGKREPLTKCLIDVFIKHQIARFCSTLYSIYYKNEYSDDEKKEIIAAFLDINSSVEKGRFVMHKVLHRIELTFADVMLLPFVERMSAFKDDLPEFVRLLDLTSLWKWFDNMMEMEWTQEHRVPVHRLKNMFRMIKSGEYSGLELPVTKYD